ncbi:Xylulose 5-phosphate/Fructose 6-phosphate phosphoketolase [Thiocapsa marina 5811]|uniref:Xylulose 5-phosphate/Fructose 6-phosphate phosphoketolase n=1 Tax=Thiocapsa marina 5811 TaxID=768671 RepID=F9U7G2_9GAMM|nr:Xylulose 5-phosphate/Fructose 6-phosphate phosphoketolase [Thiocapsa marina 5811]
MRGYGWTPHCVEGDDPMTMHQQMAATMDACYAEIRAFQDEARSSGKATRCHWPMIVLRTP